MAYPARRYIAYVRFGTGEMQTLVTSSLREIARHGGLVVAWVPLPVIRVLPFNRWPR
jgi:hypothetical protein